MALPYFWDQFFFFLPLEGLDGEGNPKFNYGFIFFPSAFYSMVTSDGDTDSNALEAFVQAWHTAYLLGKTRCRDSIHLVC